MLWKIKPRRRKLVGKHKPLYKDTDISLDNKKVDEIEKMEYLSKFHEAKEKEKKQRLILMLSLIAIGLITLLIMFLVPVT